MAPHANMSAPMTGVPIVILPPHPSPERARPLPMRSIAMENRQSSPRTLVYHQLDVWLMFALPQALSYYLDWRRRWPGQPFARVMCGHTRDNSFVQLFLWLGLIGRSRSHHHPAGGLLLIQNCRYSLGQRVKRLQASTLIAPRPHYSSGNMGIFTPRSRATLIA